MSWQQPSQNTSPMFLRSMDRKHLTHSGRDFVINQGYVEQSSQHQKLNQKLSKHDVNDNMIRIEMAPLSDNSKTVQKFRFEFTAILISIFVILMFLALTFRNSPGNDL